MCDKYVPPSSSVSEVSYDGPSKADYDALLDATNDLGSAIASAFEKAIENYDSDDDDDD